MAAPVSRIALSRGCLGSNGGSTKIRSPLSNCVMDDAVEIHCRNTASRMATSIAEVNKSRERMSGEPAEKKQCVDDPLV